jgi:hypothetical protein
MSIYLIFVQNPKKKGRNHRTNFCMLRQKIAIFDGQIIEKTNSFFFAVLSTNGTHHYTDNDTDERRNLHANVRKTTVQKKSDREYIAEFLPYHAYRLNHNQDDGI